jgi:membrane protein DedA with SNARE-associated domain
VTLDQLIQDYGYLAVVIGTFLEGETILVLAGLAAHLGYLDLPWVMAAGLAGSFSGDQLYFHLGRRHGPGILARRPAWRPRVDRVLRLLERHQNLLILGCRFTYGLRTITPFALGLSRVRAVRFLLLNGIAALAWTVSVAGAGYLFGHVVQAALGRVRHLEHALLGLVAVAGLVLWLIARRRARRPPDDPPAAP